MKPDFLDLLIIHMNEFFDKLRLGRKTERKRNYRQSKHGNKNSIIFLNS
jgi:hypothetical protein